MDDRELLELAAKAAGIVGDWNSDRGGLRIAVPWRNFTDYQTWNPLSDSGQALELAVRLELDVYVRKGKNLCEADSPWKGTKREKYEPDPYAATRRAIVRAAAALA